MTEWKISDQEALSQDIVAIKSQIKYWQERLRFSLAKQQVIFVAENPPTEGGE